MEYFDQLLMQQPPSAEELLLWELAAEYHERAEAYDKIVCTGERHGIAMPSNGSELRDINRHAKQLFNDLVERHDGDPEFRRQLKARISATAPRMSYVGRA